MHACTHTDSWSLSLKPDCCINLGSHNFLFHVLAILEQNGALYEELLDM